MSIVSFGHEDSNSGEETTGHGDDMFVVPLLLKLMLMDVEDVDGNYW